MPGAEQIEGIDWDSEAASLRLADGRVSGTGGVNRLMGDYELAGERLAFGPLATTMMAGPAGQMEAEQRFLATLARVTGWSLDRECLVLRDGEGSELIRLQKSTTAKENAMEFIHTCYRITDPAKSTAFYEALGFEKRRELPIREEAMNYFFGIPGKEVQSSS